MQKEGAQINKAIHAALQLSDGLRKKYDRQDGALVGHADVGVLSISIMEVRPYVLVL